MSGKMLCAVCNEEVVTPSPLQCGHIFHNECIESIREGLGLPTWACPECVDGGENAHQDQLAHDEQKARDELMEDAPTLIDTEVCPLPSPGTPDSLRRLAEGGGIGVSVEEHSRITEKPAAVVVGVDAQDTVPQDARNTEDLPAYSENWKTALPHDVANFLEGEGEEVADLGRRRHFCNGECAETWETRAQMAINMSSKSG